MSGIKIEACTPDDPDFVAFLKDYSITRVATGHQVSSGYDIYHFTGTREALLLMLREFYLMDEDEAGHKIAMEVNPMKSVYSGSTIEDLYSKAIEMKDMAVVIARESTETDDIVVNSMNSIGTNILELCHEIEDHRDLLKGGE